MHGLSVNGSALGRVIAAVLLVVGIAAMHHLVVTGCAASPAGHEGIHASHDESVTGLDPAPPAFADAQEVAVPSGASEPSEGHGAAACLAVLLTLWVMAPLVRYLRRRRVTHMSGLHRCDAAPAQVRPPDLHSLSVSRT